MYSTKSCVKALFLLMLMDMTKVNNIILFFWLQSVSCASQKALQVLINSAMWKSIKYYNESMVMPQLSKRTVGSSLVTSPHCVLNMINGEKDCFFLSVLVKMAEKCNEKKRERNTSCSVPLLHPSHIDNLGLSENTRILCMLEDTPLFDICAG